MKLKNNTDGKKYVYLFSGGIDSTLGYIYTMNTSSWSPVDNLVYCDLQTKYSQNEIETIKKIAKYMGWEDKLHISNVLNKLGPDLEQESAFFPNRNALMSLIASSYGADIISFGGLRDDRISDNNSEFFNLISSTLSKSLERDVLVMSTVSHLSKGELVLEAKKILSKDKFEHILGLTFSCYDPNIDGTECLKCKACFRKGTALFEAGIKRNFLDDGIIKDYSFDLKNSDMDEARKLSTQKYLDWLNNEYQRNCT